MSQDQERASLKDVINYNPEEYLSKDEMSLIRSTFKDNHKLMAILRKLLIPTISDPALPIETFGNDLFMSGRTWATMPADEAKILITAREDALKFIVGGLIKLRVLANVEEENEQETALRREQDSSK